MTFERSYRAAPLSFNEACAELRDGAGTQFDPELALLFVEHATAGLITSASDAAQQAGSPVGSAAAAGSKVAVGGV